MSKRKPIPKPQRKLAIILLEGETEEELYTELINKYCRTTPKEVRNLRGNWNINGKICEKAAQVLLQNPDRICNVFVCIDQERVEVPAYNHDLCEKALREKYKNFGQIVPVIANLMCESLFFLDIDGIYKFLKAPIAARNPQKYQNFRRLTHVHLSTLFKQHGKLYNKGHRCANFIRCLDLNKLKKAEEIKRLLEHLDSI